MSGNEGRDGQNTVQASLTGEEPTELTADELVLSAHEGTNADLFPKVLDLHVPTGSEVADVTYGKGVFWKNVPNDAYNLHASDIDPDKSRDFNRGVDCRDLPYEDNTFDCVVLDPPYAEGWFRRNKDHLAGGGTHSSFRDAYSNGEAYTGGGKYHQAVLDLYFDGGVEAKRVLKDDGTLLVKTQDEVSANTQELTHVQIINFYERELGLYTKDLFVLIRSNTPHQTGMHNQVHARKNHSYLLVFNFENDPVNAPSNDD
jgi:tRNA G10  N-methylase Trm11